MSLTQEKPKQQPTSNFAFPEVNEQFWRHEFEELNRYLSILPAPADAKRLADEDTAKHDGVIRDLESKITTLRAALETPFLTLPNQNAIKTKIERLEHLLKGEQERRRRAIALWGATIRDSKAWEHKRPRWLELKKRMSAIDSAASLLRQ